MSIAVLVSGVVLVIALAAVLAGLGALGFFGSSGVGQTGGGAERLRFLVLAQRKDESEEAKGRRRILTAERLGEEVPAARDRQSAFDPSLAQKLRYAKWTIPPALFRAIQASVIFFLCAIAWLLAPPDMRMPMIVNATIIGFSLTEWVLNRAMNKRSNAFDQDYPVMLMSYVSILKTGANPINGLEAAAKALDSGSLVRQEIEVLVERLRLGLSEEQALNAFAEDIFHPETELFIQGLILNMRVGGRLSATLERLAKQVRKRQQFKEQAVSAVALERNSIVAIALIMCVLFGFLTVQAPEIVSGIFTAPIGRMLFSWSTVLILLGFILSRKVTSLKI